MKSFKRAFWVFCVLSLAWNANSYRLDVRERASIERWTYETSPDGRYTLAFGRSGDWVWVRLREKGNTEVLADRWFKNREQHWVYWRDNQVSYSRGSEGPIYLPPMWLEKWFAKLP
ncbi:MAG: hypothetical protein Q7T87_11860 [Polaromonas sp.]|nr:hypothetical protein [Polaromonas sp.]